MTKLSTLEDGGMTQTPQPMRVLSASADPALRKTRELVLIGEGCEVKMGHIEAYNQSWPKIQKILDQHRITAQFIYQPNPPAPF
jgi:hypothetical protein